MTGPPLVSIAIPLFRSARFVDNIAANIDRLTYPALEILVSDRHGADDAIERLAERYSNDPRIRFLRGADGADWITHYNDLVRTARGEYLCWMPHDDVYEAGYVDALAAALDAHPEALLAFGVMNPIAVDTSVPVGPFTPPPISPGEPWSLRVAFRWLLSWELFRVMRGLCRRREVIERSLFVPRTYRTVLADVCWAFSIAVVGPLIYVPAASCTKRYHAASASAGWRFDAAETASQLAVMTRALWRSPHPRLKVAAGTLVLVYVAVLRMLWRVARLIAGVSEPAAPRRARAWVLGLPLRFCARRQ